MNAHLYYGLWNSFEKKLLLNLKPKKNHPKWWICCNGANYDDVVSNNTPWESNPQRLKERKLLNMGQLYVVEVILFLCLREWHN